MTTPLAHEYGRPPFHRKKRDEKDAQNMVDPLQSRLCQAASRTQSGRMVEHPGFRLNPSNKNEHRLTHSLRLVQIF